MMSMHELGGKARLTGKFWGMTMLKTNLFKLDYEKCNHEGDSINRNKIKDESDKTSNKLIRYIYSPE